MSESGVRGLVRNRVYLGEARYGDTVKKDAHRAIIPRPIWQRCQAPGRKSARSGRVTQRHLLQGLATCSSCGRVMYLSGGKRHGKDYEHYICRRLECSDHAYSRAAELDAFVLNFIEEAATGLDYDGIRTGRGDEAVWRTATFVARLGGDDAEIAEAEAALEDARADLDSLLADTNLRRILGADKHAGGRGQLRRRRQQGRERPGRGPRAQHGLVGAGRPAVAARVGMSRAPRVARADGPLSRPLSRP